MQRMVRWCLLGVIGVVLACTPALNWRETRFATSSLRVLLPCKPDKAQRDVDMGGRVLRLEMLGCDAEGATFAISHVVVRDAAEVPRLLQGWKQAVLTHLGATELREAAWVPAGAWGLPQSVRVHARAPRPERDALSVDAAWFARADSSGLHLFHAIHLASSPTPQAAETFFAGMAFP